jgi:hypothetical protein
VLQAIHGLLVTLVETFFRVGTTFSQALGAATGDLIHLSSDPPCLDDLQLLRVVQFPPSFWQNKTTQHLYICIYVYIYVCVYIYIYMYIYALNIGVQVSLLFPDLHSLRYLLKSGITGLYGSCIFILSINFHTTFHNSYTNLYSHQ